MFDHATKTEDLTPELKNNLQIYRYSFIYRQRFRIVLFFDTENTFLYSALLPDFSSAYKKIIQEHLAVQLTKLGCYSVEFLKAPYSGFDLISQTKEMLKQSEVSNEEMLGKQLYFIQLYLINSTSRSAINQLPPRIVNCSDLAIHGFKQLLKSWEIVDKSCFKEILEFAIKAAGIEFKNNRIENSLDILARFLPLTELHGEFIDLKSRILRDKARVLKFAGNITEAVHFCKLSLAVEPQNGLNWSLLGDLYSDLQNNEAYSCYKKAAALFSANNDLTSRYWYNRCYGRIYSCCRKNYKKSVPFFKKMLECAESLGDIRKICTATSYLSNIYFFYKKYLKSVALDKKILAQLEILNDQKLKEMVMLNLVINLSALNRYQEALTYQLEALKLIKDSQDKGFFARELFELGNLYYFLNDYTNAAKYLNKYLDFTPRDNSFVKNDVIAYLILSRIYSSKQNYKKAISVLNFGEKLLDNSHDHSSQTELEAHRCYIYQEIKKYDLLIKHARRMLTYAASSDFSGDYRAYANYLLGWAWHEKGDLVKTKKYYSISCKIYSSLILKSASAADTQFLDEMKAVLQNL